MLGLLPLWAPFLGFNAGVLGVVTGVRPLSGRGGAKAVLGRSSPFAQRVGAGDDIQEFRRNLGLTGLSLGLAQLIELLRHIVVG